MEMVLTTDKRRDNDMFIIGIILLVFGILAIAFGIAQNTILHMMFADLNERLARFNTEQGVADIFLGPGQTEIIVGIVAIIAGIVLIVIHKKRKNRWLAEYGHLYYENESAPDEVEHISDVAEQTPGESEEQ